MYQHKILEGYNHQVKLGEQKTVYICMLNFDVNINNIQELNS